MSTEMTAEASVEATLSHYGRKGMKWGQRIFTSGGRAAAKTEKEVQKGKVSEDFASARSSLAKSSSELSNQEVEQLVRRLNLERQLQQALPKAPQSRGAAAKKFTTDLLVDVGKTELKRVAKTAAQIQVENAISARQMSGKEFRTTLGTRIAPKEKKNNDGNNN